LVEVAGIEKLEMNAAIEGYVYVAEENRGAMSAAKKGSRVSLPEPRPPFIVVNENIDLVIVARWPGKLWLVRVVDALSDELERNLGLGRPNPRRYVRAIAVDVLEEVPAWKLFGPHGAAICEVIDKATQLDSATITALARSRHPDAENAYSRAWGIWIKGMKSRPAGIHSPVNCGFPIISFSVRERANAICGEAAFVLDEDGEKCLEPTWSAASKALCEAAMALGAPELSPNEDRNCLAKAWISVFGPIPPNHSALA
jgi:hypothetical protein